MKRKKQFVINEPFYFEKLSKVFIYLFYLYWLQTCSIET
jgi:hypothetical protein